MNQMRNEAVVHRGNLSNAISGADTVRAFGGRAFLSGIFHDQVGKMQQIKRDMVQGGTRGQVNVADSGYAVKGAGLCYRSP